MNLQAKVTLSEYFLLNAYIGYSYEIISNLSDKYMNVNM